MFFSYSLYLESGFLFAAYLTVADLAQLGILVHCLVSSRSQYLVRLLSLYWITVGHTIHDRRTVTPKWYWTHIVPEFGLDSSWITGACHCTQHTMFFNLCWIHIKVMNIKKCDGFLNWNDHEVTNQHNQCISSYTRNKYKK